MTTTLSADDVRRWTIDPWCPKCSTPAYLDRDGVRVHCCGQLNGVVSGIFTRCPGCQPEGMEWWRVYKGWRLRKYVIDVSHAIDLILMAIARDATAAYANFRGKPIETAYDNITTAIMSSEFEDAVKWRHRLKDLEEQT